MTAPTDTAVQRAAQMLAETLGIDLGLAGAYILLGAGGLLFATAVGLSAAVIALSEGRRRW